MGKYSVPKHIRDNKPKGSLVKILHNKYYVYDRITKQYPNGKWGSVTGKMIGYIDEKQGFIPNDNYIVSEEISTLEYGQYAIVVNNSKQTLERLTKFFNPQDAYCIYIIAIVHVVNEFVPLKDIHNYVEQSYLSKMYPSIKFSYHKLSKLLDALGRRQGQVISFEQSLLNECSKEITIDGHDLKSTSHLNDLAERGNKFSTFRDMQINILMAYDINTDIPLISRAYPGSILDKTSVKDLLDFNSYHDMLFVVDRGFYSNENIELFSQNNNHYIIPLSPNLKQYKNVTKDMELHEIFIYEKEKKITSIEYKELILNEKTKIIVYRDITQSAKDKADFLKNMEIDSSKYTKEKYTEVKDFFGVIVLQTNLNIQAKEIYVYYKKRWKVETFFNYFKNRVDINALGLSDYYTTQGMCFIMLIVGLIYQELKLAIKENIKGKTINDCLLEARFIKLNKKNQKWYTSNAKKSLQELTEN